MARYASIAKAGFYPTPQRVVEIIGQWLVPSRFEPGRLIDPCCGEGVAAAYLANVWGLSSYGVELDSQRAKRAAGVMDKVVCSDYAKVRVSRGGFQVLFLNPPYDYDPDSQNRRLEYVFLVDTTRWLQAGGVLIYIVPQRRVDRAVAKFLAANYERLQAWRFPPEEYEAFHQVVIFGVAKAQPRQDDAGADELYRACLGELPILAEPPELMKYPIPPANGRRFYFRLAEFSPVAALEEARRVGAWTAPEWRALFEPRTFDQVRPLMPLKKGHLAMLIAAGLFRNIVLERNGRRVIIKGRTYKITEEIDSDEPNTRVERERFITEIGVLDLATGEYQRISDANALAGFMEEWRSELVAKVQETYRPLYEFDLEAEGPQVNAVLASIVPSRCLPGQGRPGLLEAQKHTAVALLKRLSQAKAAICVGEMGTGKTVIAATTAELLRVCLRQSKPVLVLCPPHLVRKWMREVTAVPGALVMELRRLGDVDKFLAKVQPGRLAVAVLSRERAKLGGGWTGAYVQRHVLTCDEVKDGYGGKIRQWRADKVFACPDCGHPVSEIVNGREHGFVASAEYFTERKRFCFRCRAPLFQMTHLNGRCRTPDKSVKERYPLADFIRRKYAGRFGLLIADEVHQYKGQSTDQGYAFRALAASVNKVLALTGTLYGGRATSVFYTLHALLPEVRRRFGWSDAALWVETYGTLIRITKVSQGDEGFGVYSGKRRSRQYVREGTGVSPALAELLLGATVFVSLSDLGIALPPRTEYAEVVSMSPPQAASYFYLRDALKAELRRRLSEGDRSLLAAYLQALLGRPNASHRQEVVVDKFGNIVATAPALSGEFPKERWLVDLCRHEKEKGRRVLIYCRQTDRRDIMERLAELLRAQGLQVSVLRNSVSPEEREEWVTQQVKKGLHVLLAPFKMLETGLDLIEFPTIVCYEIEYSLFVVGQATRRSWRLGQTAPVDVWYVVYRDTMEASAAALVGDKQAAAQRLYGDDVDSALVQTLDDRSVLETLARAAIEEDTTIPDLHTFFRRATVSAGGNGHDQPARPVVPPVPPVTVDLTRLLTPISAQQLSLWEFSAAT